MRGGETIKQQLTLVNDSSTVVSIGYALHRDINSGDNKISNSDDRTGVIIPRFICTDRKAG